MRALCYVQHLHGVGHYVRMHTIAATLAETHETVLVEGGVAVPRPSRAVEPARLVLPPLTGHDGAVAEGVVTDRVDRLVAAVGELRPDVVVVEHYPFSKWELETEIEAMVAAARDANPRVRIVCSLRDIPPRTRLLAHTPDYDALVVARLGRSFDAVLVHADPEVLPLVEHFPAADRIAVPVHHTGVVVGPASEPLGSGVVATTDGPEATPFLRSVIDACALLRHEGHLASAPLHVFAAFGASAADREGLEAAASHPDVVVHEFTPDYAAHLSGAALSVSRAGYNTLAEVARSRVPAVVVPEPRTDDQGPRAAAFARAGAVDVVHGPRPHPRVLADALLRACERGRPTPTIDLTGAATTRRILESLVDG